MAFLEAFSTTWARGDDVSHIDAEEGHIEPGIGHHINISSDGDRNEVINTPARGRGRPRKKKNLRANVNQPQELSITEEAEQS